MFLPLFTVIVALSPRPASLARMISADSSGCAPNEQRITETPPPSATHIAAFQNGEVLNFAVSFGPMHVGSGEMRFYGRDTVRGETAFKASFAIGGGFWKASVHDTSVSWFDTTTFNSLRFVQGLHEPHYHSERDFQIFPSRETYQSKDGQIKPSVADPLDDVSFVYFMRTMPLEPGQCYELHRYFQPEGNPVIVHVVKRDTVEVPAGKFPTFLLRPEIRTSGAFSQNGRAALWLSDDSARVIVQLKTHLSFGSINLYLRHIGPEQ